MKYPDTDTLARVIDDARQAQGKSVKGFAAEVNIARTTLERRLKDGDFKSLELAAVARALGTTVSALWRQVEAESDNAA